VTMKLMTCAKVSTISCENACSYDQSLPLVIFFFRWLVCFSYSRDHPVEWLIKWLELTTEC